MAWLSEKKNFKIWLLNLKLKSIFIFTRSVLYSINSRRVLQVSNINSWHRPALPDAELDGDVICLWATAGALVPTPLPPAVCGTPPPLSPFGKWPMPSATPGRCWQGQVGRGFRDCCFQATGSAGTMLSWLGLPYKVRKQLTTPGNGLKVWYKSKY